jgi:hypothetical protein
MKAPEKGVKEQVQMQAVGKVLETGVREGVSQMTGDAYKHAWCRILEDRLHEVLEISTPLPTDLDLEAVPFAHYALGEHVSFEVERVRTYRGRLQADLRLGTPTGHELDEPKTAPAVDADEIPF